MSLLQEPEEPPHGHHTVVATDLAGYGGSFRPAPAADHAPHGERAMALDQVEAMAALGFERFAVAGHDRRGRVAYRMALDHPDAVERLAVLDVKDDDADREAGRRIACPTLVLWSARGGLLRSYPDVLDVWRPWATDVRGRGIDASHFLAEDCPETIASELRAFTDQED